MTHTYRSKANSILNSMKKNFENPSKYFQDIEELRNSRVQKTIKSLLSSPMTHIIWIIYIILKHFFSKVGNDELQRNSGRDEVILTGYDVIKKAEFSQFKLVLYKNNLYNKFYTASNGGAKTLRSRWNWYVEFIGSGFRTFWPTRDDQTVVKSGWKNKIVQNRACNVSFWREFYAEFKNNVENDI